MSGSRVVRRIVIGAWEFFSATALIIVATLLILLMLEVAVRVRRTIANRGSGGPPATVAGDPRAADWYADYQREFEATRVMRWQPYVYFRRRASAPGRYINVDTLGHRRTPQPTTPATPIARVTLFGGSTMWGESQREDHMLAAEIARRFQTLAGPGARVEVTNNAEAGYVLTQELVQLMLDLRAGSRPDVVLFYDGLNDAAATVQWGVGGAPQNESNRVSDFALGRALDRSNDRQVWRGDLRAVGVLAGRAMQRSALVQWARARKAVPPRTFVPADSAARTTVRHYVETVKLVESLAATYGFTPVYVWQTSLHVTEKQLDPYEANLRRQIERDPFHRRLQETHRLILPLLDSAMQNVAPGRFVDVALTFKGDTLPVFTDRVGHNTEVSIPRIVDTFWPAIERAAQPVIAARRAAR